MAYDRSIADVICARIAEGESLRAVCRDEGMPSHWAFMKWADEDEALGHQYARAMDARMEKMADDILEIADDGTNDTYVDDEGNARVQNDVIQRSKLRVDTRKWLMSKLAPKKYGDKVVNEHTGEGGGNIRVEFVRPKPADDA